MAELSELLDGASAAIVRPGDRILLTYQHYLSDKERHELSECVRLALPDVEVIIADGATAHIIRPD